MTLTEVAARSAVVGLLVCIESVLSCSLGHVCRADWFIVVMLVYIVEQGVVLVKLCEAVLLACLSNDTLI